MDYERRHFGQALKLAEYSPSCTPTTGYLPPLDKSHVTVALQCCTEQGTSFSASVAVGVQVTGAFSPFLYRS
eukprot:1528993-Amphidinium_carterae.2